MLIAARSKTMCFPPYQVVHSTIVALLIIWHKHWVTVELNVWNTYHVTIAAHGTTEEEVECADEGHHVDGEDEEEVSQALGWVVQRGAKQSNILADGQLLQQRYGRRKHDECYNEAVAVIVQTQRTEIHKCTCKSQWTLI